MVKINGKDIDAVGVTLLEYLKSESYNPKAIAVEINEEIVPKSEYGNTLFKDGDIVEIVNFVGGG